VPSATLDIVGAGPPAEVRSLNRLDGVTVNPDVLTVAPFLERGRVAIVPLRIGTGSRLKALEAMAAGRPVVGTAIGLGGLRFEAGRHALVADDPSAFTEAVVRCLRDRETASEFAAAGRALVEECYSWQRISADFVSMISARLTEADREFHCE
jgi:glycosyltransferase involved in cell wall biosynthesis